MIREPLGKKIDKRVKHYGGLVIIVIMVGVAADGNFDLNNLKNTLLQWKNNKFNVCPSNKNRLLNLVNLVCSTAQPTNVTSRDSCYTCFSRAASVPEGSQTLAALSVCATQYFANTSYATCAVSLAAMATSGAGAGAATVVTGALAKFGSAPCYTGYCDFVRCLRRVNANNLCTREARTGVNITVDADNVRFYKNVTSCLLARARCGNFNPVTGEPQSPGYTSGVPAANALQITTAGDLRLLSFPANIQVAGVFCATSNTLSQSTWLTTVC